MTYDTGEEIAGAWDVAIGVLDFPLEEPVRTVARGRGGLAATRQRRHSSQTAVANNMAARLEDERPGVADRADRKNWGNRISELKGKGGITRRLQR